MITKEEREKCECLMRWTEVKIDEVDAILEWLKDSDLMTEEGKRFVTAFWDFCWHKGNYPVVGKANNS